MTLLNPHVDASVLTVCYCLQEDKSFKLVQINDICIILVHLYPEQSKAYHHLLLDVRPVLQLALAGAHHHQDQLCQGIWSGGASINNVILSISDQFQL